MPIEIPDPQARSSSPTNRIKRWKPYIIGATAALALLALTSYAVAGQHDARLPPSSDEPSLQCSQAAKIYPDFDAARVHNSTFFTSKVYHDESVQRLAGAVQIPTVSYDDMSFNVTDDPRFDVFTDFHRYLFSTFPRTAQHVETVNTYGLLYTIEGTDPSRKPVVFMAHQDVVPVPDETLDQWVHPPFSGHFDGEWLYGRGSSDTKNLLIATLEAVEELLAESWRPKYTLLIAFGFDEEIQGFRGARKLAEEIERRYGRDSVDLVVDEGGAFIEAFGAYFGLPSVAEKGRINIRATLNTPGGHSSMPPDHTSIGIISDFVTQLESDLSSPSLPAQDAVVKSLYSCFGHHAPNVPEPLHSVFSGLGSPFFDEQLTDWLAEDLSTRVLVETTQAIDVIRGGVKVNALPEQVVLDTNYRIKPDSSVDKETKRFVDHAARIATTYGLSLNYSNVFSGSGEESEIVKPGKDVKGHLLVELTDALDVAPISPYYNSSIWDVLGGTTRHVLEDVANGFDNLPTYLAPNLLVGNTDTAHFWNLTSNIYRYSLMNFADSDNYHTVGERLRFRSHLSTTIFCYELLLNLNQL